MVGFFERLLRMALALDLDLGRRGLAGDRGISMATVRAFIRLAINGEILDISGPDCFMMLADYLRKRLYLTGTKIVCAEGDCGACTILRAFQPPGGSDAPKFVSVNSCITMMVQLDGCHIVTIEALADRGTLSMVQQAMVDHHGSQCGYCTPGIAMSLTGMFEACKAPPDVQTIKNNLTGNLCRCTGYSPIIEAAAAVEHSTYERLADRFLTTDLVAALQESAAIPIAIHTDFGQVFAPVTLAAMSGLRQKWPTATILSSGTDLGVQFNKGLRPLGDLISLHLLADLYKFKVTSDHMEIGARVTLEELRQLCLPYVPEFSDLLNVFASPQIKHIATLAGNIANASPIGDTLPFLLVSDATVNLRQKGQQRTIPLKDFFIGYRKTALFSGEFIESVQILLPKAGEVLRLYKACTRKDLDISAVSAAFLLSFKENVSGAGPQINKVRLALGGVAAVPLRLLQVEEWLTGKPWTDAVQRAALEQIQVAIHPLTDVRGSGAYRRLLVTHFFRQFCLEVTRQGGAEDAASHP